MNVAIVGAGRVGTAVGVLLRAAGHDVVAASGREATERRIASFLPGVPLVAAGRAATGADLVIVAVPDDAIAEVAAEAARGCRPGTWVAHCSGALGLDVLDVQQFHVWNDEWVGRGSWRDAIEGLKDEGKIRHVGVSNFSPAEMDALSGTIEVETDQPPYNLFNRGIEGDVLPYCREQDVGLLVYGPLSHGLLSGSFDPAKLADEDWRRGHEPFAGENLERNLEVVARLEEFAEQRGHTLPQLAVAWVLAQPGVHVAITGARRPQHVEGIAPAAEIQLSADDLAQIDELTGAGKAWGLTPEG